MPSEAVPAAAAEPTTAGFVAQCEADYEQAEITAIGHSDSARGVTLLLAVVELLHAELEANPLIGVGPPIGYPRRRSLGDRGGTLLLQRWRLPVREGLEWYRGCSGGTTIVPGTPRPILVNLGQLGDDPPFPQCVTEIQDFWPLSPFWGERPGRSRWHRMIPLAAIDVTSGWEAAEFEKARDWLLKEVHIDLFSRSVLLGSCHLRLPNPIYRRLRRRVSDDWKSMTFELMPFPNKSVENLELTLWNQRAWGATKVRRLLLRSGENIIEVPEGVEQVAHAVTCPQRGLLEHSELSGFIESAQLTMELVTEERRVQGARPADGSPPGFSVPIIGIREVLPVGNARPAGALPRLAADEEQRSAGESWSRLAIRWFDNDAAGGAQALRDIIGSARRRVDFLDPYFGHSDLGTFALATAIHGLPVRILTSSEFCTTDSELDIESGEALLRVLNSVREQEPRFAIEIKVMAGAKSPVHDRFLIVDETVWVLGASLNEFGNRGTLLLRLPTPPSRGQGGRAAFSIPRDVFDEHWNRPADFSTPLAEWVARRSSIQTSFSDRVRKTKAVVCGCLRRVRKVWRA